jgi:hypothetical protein
MEENHQPYHQIISENRLTPIQHGIQHARLNGSITHTHQIWMAMRPAHATISSHAISGPHQKSPLINN